MIGIIGGTGFIGLNLCLQLCRQEIPCRTLSRNGLILKSPSLFDSTLSKVEHTSGDFRDASTADEFVKQCECIVMVASHLLPSSSVGEVEEVISSFSPAFVHLLEASVNFGIRHFLFVSSGGTVYGETCSKTPVSEDHPLNSQCAYGSFCAFLEQLIRNTHNQHGLPFTVLRVGNPYGLLKRPNASQGIVDHYIRSARAEQAFTLFGDGSETRDYIYMDDLARILAQVLAVPAQNDTFNVGMGSGHTSNEVITAIRRHFDLPEIPIIARPRRLGDIGYSVLNIEKFERAYGIRPTIALDEGLSAYSEMERLSASA